MDRKEGRHRFFRGESGLTLVEVLVALVILGLIGAILIKISMASAMWTRDAIQKGTAGDFAYAVMETVRADPTLLQTGWLEGNDVSIFLNPSGPGAMAPYAWRIQSEPWQGSQTLKQVHVDIYWQRGAEDKHVELWSLVYMQNPE